MLKFFRHSYIAQLVVIIVMALALWIPVFVSSLNDTITPDPVTPLCNLITGIFGSSHIALPIFTFAVFITSVLFFNSMLSVNQLVTRNSSIGAFVYVLCICSVPVQQEYYQFLIASPFIMMAMQTIYLIYQVEKPEMYLMNAGIFLSIASMIYFPSIILLLWVLLSMMVMDIRGGRYFLIPIVGFVFPYFLLFVWFYFSKTLVENIEAYGLAFNELQLMRLELSTENIAILIVVFILSMLSILKIRSGNTDNSISTRKKVNVTIMLMAFSVVMLFMQEPLMSNGLIFLVLAVFASMALCYVKKTKIVDIIIILIMVAVFANHYLPLFGVSR